MFASGPGHEISAPPRPATCGAPDGERGGGSLDRPRPGHRNGAPLVFPGPRPISGAPHGSQFFAARALNVGPAPPRPTTHHLGPRFVFVAPLFFRGPASVPVDRDEPHVFPSYRSPLPYFCDEPSRMPHLNMAPSLQALDRYRAPCNCSFPWLDRPDSV